MSVKDEDSSLKKEREKLYTVAFIVWVTGEYFLKIFQTTGSLTPIKLGISKIQMEIMKVKYVSSQFIFGYYVTEILSQLTKTRRHFLILFSVFSNMWPDQQKF